MYDMVQDVPEGLFFMRDNSSADGAPVEGCSFVEGPLMGARADRALRCLLQLPPFSLSQEAASVYTVRSLKPFMLKHTSRVGCDRYAAMVLAAIGRFS